MRGLKGSDGPYAATRFWSTTRQLGRGGLPPPTTLTANFPPPLTSKALPACSAATSPVRGGFSRGLCPRKRLPSQGSWPSLRGLRGFDAPSAATLSPRKDTTQPYHSGQIYDPDVPTLINEQLKYLDVLYDFNMTRPSEMPKRQALLTQMLAEIGEHDREYFYKNERIDWEKIP